MMRLVPVAAGDGGRTEPPRAKARRRQASPSADNAARLPQRYDPDAPLFLISTAARLAGMHPQTLRTYDRLGLVVPQRTAGRGRRYTLRDIEKLKWVQYLSQDEGINLTGVRHIMELRAEVERLQKQTVRLAEEVRVLRRGPNSGRVFTASRSEGVWLRTSRMREIQA